MKKTFSCELALIVGIALAGVGMNFLIRGAFGLSTFASVSFVLSEIFDFISFGMMNVLFQVVLITGLVIVTRQPNVTYLAGFVIAFLFGLLIDFFAYFFILLPDLLLFRIGYFIIGILIMSFGVAMFIKSKLPIMPFDMFVRDLAIFFNLNFKNTRMLTDIIAIGLSISLSLLFVGEINGVGLGTVIFAFTFGPLLQMWIKLWEKHFEFKPTFKIMEPVIKAGQLNNK
jgi:uncharacterized membrane protein YczE